MKRILPKELLNSILGDPRVAFLVYLAMVSSQLAEPFSVFILSPSSSGKSFLLKLVKQFIPANWIFFASEFSPQVIPRLGKEAFKHKTILVDEIRGLNDETLFKFRILMSEGIYKKQVVSPKKEVEELVIEGPISVVNTSSWQLDDIEEDDINRVLILSVDQSPETTQQIMAKQAYSATVLPDENSKKKITRHHRHLENLNIKEIIIPYANNIVPKTNQMSARRDFPKMLAIIKTIAFLRQHEKPSRSYGSQVYINADLVDYEIAHDLFAIAFKTTLAKENELKESYDELKQHFPDQKGFTPKDIETQLGLSRSTVKKLVRNLLEERVIILKTAANSNKPATYKLSSLTFFNQKIFVTPDELAALCGRNKKKPQNAQENQELPMIDLTNTTVNLNPIHPS